MLRILVLASLATSFLFAQEKSTDARLANSTAVLREIMGSPDKGIPEDLIEKAQCVVVVPDLIKGAFIVGGKYGRGFASCRHGNRWSPPAAVRIEGGSFGLQLGGASTDLIMLVMNRRGMDRLLSTKFTIGGEAQAAAGPVGRQTSAQTDAAMHAEILTWSRSRGLFGGISLDGATLREDGDENKKLYGHEITNREILETAAVSTPPAARDFIATLNRIARPGEYKTTESRPSNEPVAPHAQTRKGPAPESLNEPGGRMILSEEEVHFDAGKSDIPASADAALSKVAQMLKDNPSWKIRIEGFTDTTGNKAANMKLSQARAEAVMNWLADHGIDRSRMTAKGYGDARPIGDNTTAEGRAKNRRVELVRTDNLQSKSGV